MYLEHDVGVPGVELAEAGRVVGDRFEILLGLGRRIGISGMRFLSKGNSMTRLLLMICVQVTTMQRDYGYSDTLGVCQKCHKITDCHSIPKIPSAPRPPPYLNPPDFQPRVLTGAVEDHVGCRARTEKDERASGNVGKLRTEVEDLEQYGARVLLGSPADVYTSWRGEIVSWSLSA